MNLVKTATHRAPSSVAAVGDRLRIVSDDGSRWAYNVNRKRSLGDHRFDVIEVWVMKERRNGKVTTVHSAASEQTAVAFVSMRS